MVWICSGLSWPSLFAGFLPAADSIWASTDLLSQPLAIFFIVRHAHTRSKMTENGRHAKSSYVLNALGVFKRLRRHLRWRVGNHHHALWRTQHIPARHFEDRGRKTHGPIGRRQDRGNHAWR